MDSAKSFSDAGQASQYSAEEQAHHYSAEELARIITREAQLRGAQELASIGSWEWDIRNDAITWSDELYAMYGVEPEDRKTFDTSFESFMRLIHPEDRELLGNTVQHAMETGQRYSVDHRMLRPNGEVRYLHGQGAVVMEDGRPVRMYGIAQDVTDQHQAYKHRFLLEQAEKIAEFRAELLSMVAHELNTPLTPLRLQTHVLTMNGDDLPSGVRRAVEIIDRNVRRLGLLVSDVLDMSRSETGNMRLRIGTVSLQEIIQETADTFEVSAQEKGITFDFTGTDHFSIEADAHRLTQVLQNLVKNAIKFTPPGGTISVTTKDEGDHACFTVQDTGRGLTPEKIAALFRPFAQVHEDQGSGGHGLGLFISKGIVEAHGGTIEVESKGEGKGSTFRVCIPKSPAADSSEDDA